MSSWELLLKLNELLTKRTLRRDEAMPCPSDVVTFENLAKRGSKFLEERIGEFDLPFELPEVHLLGVLWSNSDTGD